MTSLANPKMILMRNNMIARQDDMPNANFEFSSNPTIATNPIKVNMSWLNTLTGEIFVCIDNTVGANIWVGSLGNVVQAFTAPIPLTIINYEPTIVAASLGWTDNLGFMDYRSGYFYSRDLNNLSSQKLDVSEYGWMIDNLSLQVAFTFEYGGVNDGDTGAIGLQFYNSAQGSLGAVSFSSNYQGINETTWPTGSKTLAIPSDTRFIELWLKSTRSSGTVNNAYKKNMTATISEV